MRGRPAQPERRGPAAEGGLSRRVIEQAAVLEGQTLTEYAVSNLVRSARETIQGSQVTELSRRDWKAFTALLQADAEPNEALKRAAKRHRKRRA